MIQTDSAASTITAAEIACMERLERLMATDELREWEPSGPAFNELFPVIAQPSAREKNEVAEVRTQPLLLDEYLTPAQLAAELGKTVRTLDRWQLQGRGPYYTYMGKTKMYRRGAVIEWLRRCETSPNPRRRIM